MFADQEDTNHDGHHSVGKSFQTYLIEMEVARRGLRLSPRSRPQVGFTRWAKKPDGSKLTETRKSL